MRIEQKIKRFTKGQAITNIILTKKKKKVMKLKQQKFIK